MYSVSIAFISNKRTLPLINDDFMKHSFADIVDHRIYCAKHYILFPRDEQSHLSTMVFTLLSFDDIIYLRVKCVIHYVLVCTCMNTFLFCRSKGVEEDF